jgi:hypothetical protein
MFVGVLLLALPSALRAQREPSRPARLLGQPIVVSTDRFAEFPLQVIELASGELLVASGAGRVAVHDSVFNLRRVVIVGAAPSPDVRFTVGSSIGFRLMRFRGDSVLVASSDPIMPVLSGAAERGRDMAFGRPTDLLAMARGANRLDWLERFVYVAPPAPLGIQRGVALANLNVRADTAPLVAYDQRARRLDTLAYVRTGSLSRSVQETDAAGRRTMRTIQYPFSQDDAWGVLADGTVMIVRAVGCTVDLVAATGITRAARPIGCDRPSLSKVDKDTMVARYAQARGRMSPTATMSFATADDLPDIRPAYVGNGIADDQGNLWLQRAAFTAPGGSYDIVDKTGALVDRVVLPVRGQLIGIGARFLYMTDVTTARTNGGMSEVLLVKVPR